MASEYDVIEWAQEMGIFMNPDAKSQILKTVEEIGEVIDCLLKGKPIEELELELGDVQVTLDIFAHIKGTTMGKSRDAAYKKIRDRTGRMIDGVFVKESDLK